MPRRPSIRVKNTRKKTRNEGSRDRYRTSRHLLKNLQAETYREPEALINSTRNQGDGTTIIQGQRIFLPPVETKEKIESGIISVDGRLGVAERMT